jgi:hypothetical protein
MPTFRPPIDNVTYMGSNPQPWDSAEKRLTSRLFRHYAPLPRGRNVYKLVDGTYSEDDQFDISVVEITYHGGHEIPITEEEAADLTAAGYGAYIE